MKAAAAITLAAVTFSAAGCGVQSPYAGEVDTRQTTTTINQPTAPTLDRGAAQAITAYTVAARTVAPQRADALWRMQVRLATGKLKTALRRYPPLSADSAAQRRVRQSRRVVVKTVVPRSASAAVVTADEIETGMRAVVARERRFVVAATRRPGGWRIRSFTVQP